MSTGFPDYLSGFQQPNALYVSATDKLRVAAASSQTAETVTVYYRLWNTSRQIVRGSFTVSPASSRAISTADQVMQEGFLLSVSCKAAVATSRGQTFARVFLNDSTLGLGNPSNMLMADYVTTVAAPSYPNGRVLMPTEGPGWIRNIPVANPAAATDWTLTVPNNARWKVLSIFCKYVADANPGNRASQFILENGNPSGVGGGTGTISTGAHLAADGALTAGLTWFYIGMPIAPYSAILGSSVVSFPINTDVRLIGNGSAAPAGADIHASTVNMQAGDQWSQVGVNVEEWIDNG